MARSMVSREGSLRRDEHNSRRTSRSSESNPNVFSDDYAVSIVESNYDLTPVDSIQDSLDHFSIRRQDTRMPEQSRSIPLSALPNHISDTERPISISKRPFPSTSVSAPHRALSSVTQSDVGTQRTLSTSSRFSIARPESPYRGPTAPSQPYAMYPQVTRASSIASESTLRPTEQTFISAGGPEHPYALYQNTVPEQEEDGSHQGLPLGYHGLNSSYRAGSNPSSNDVGDIVGSDGHVEQLPPYTRYADNVIAKGDMGSFESPSVSVIDDSTRSGGNDPDRPSSAFELNPRESQQSPDESARKEGWLTRKNRRKCLGVPFWAFACLAGVIFIAAALGGVIGGVIGNKRGVDQHLSSTATTTIWLDADPASTDSSTPPCPTGSFDIELIKTEQINDCIDDPDHADTWACLNFAEIGVEILDNGPGMPLQIQFDDYFPQQPPRLPLYGPQPPDLNNTPYDLHPFIDKVQDELGVALFFYAFFDKLVILREEELSPPEPNKRSVPADIARNKRSYPGQLAPGHKPWYCFWNSTINEFWIFLDQDVSTPNSSIVTSTTSVGISTTQSSTITAAPTSPFSETRTTYSLNQANVAAAAARTYGDPEDFSWPDPTSAPTVPDDFVKRNYHGSTEAKFTKKVKMVEKRKPHSNFQPYCQQMQVLDNYEIVPTQVPTICIVEDNFAQPTGSYKRSVKRLSKRGNDGSDEMRSNCICEWYSPD